MNREELAKKVKQIVHRNCYTKGYICSADLLMDLGVLKKKAYEDWRFGRIDYLERACTVNLKQLTLISSLMRKHAAELKLKSSFTAYHAWGKGPKRALRFSKSGNKKIETLYATHYIDPVRIAELRKGKKTS